MSAIHPKCSQTEPARCDLQNLDRAVVPITAERISAVGRGRPGGMLAPQPHAAARPLSLDQAQHQLPYFAHAGGGCFCNASCGALPEIELSVPLAWACACVVHVCARGKCRILQYASFARAHRNAAHRGLPTSNDVRTSGGVIHEMVWLARCEGIRQGPCVSLRVMVWFAWRPSAPLPPPGLEPGSLG